MTKTAASRHWIEAAAARIVELREHGLAKTALFGLLLDGVVVGNGAVVLIALGLTCTGEKVVLDFEVGNSENAVVCTALEPSKLHFMGASRELTAQCPKTSDGLRRERSRGIWGVEPAAWRPIRRYANRASGRLAPRCQAVAWGSSLRA